MIMMPFDKQITLVTYNFLIPLMMTESREAGINSLANGFATLLENTLKTYRYHNFLGSKGLGK